MDACVRDGMRPSSIFGSSINGSINPLGTVTQFQAAMSGNTNGNTIGSNSNGNNVTNDSNIPGFVFQIYCFTLDFMPTLDFLDDFFATRLSQGALPWI